MMDQLAITRTDDDALAARASAVKLGYLNDAYIKYFVKTTDRKAPIINRGTYVRTCAIDQVIHQFLTDPSTTTERQIISLGAGSDTRFFNLAAKAIEVHGKIPFRYHEIDFPDVCQRKAMTMTMKKGLSSLLHKQDTAPVIDGRRGSIQSRAYTLHPMDLSTIPEPGTILINMESTLPTLIISEVCLIYLEVEAADRVLQWSRSFKKAALVIYEPIEGDDAFGQMMVRNLAARGLQLRTLNKYATLERQRQRLFDAGYSTSRCCTMDDIYNDWITATERQRISQLEIFDEVEEWLMLAQHYCVALGWRGLAEFKNFVEVFS